MYNWELRGMLRASTVSRSNYTAEEMQEIDGKVKAIEKLNERVMYLNPKDRVRRRFGRRTRRVWLLESLSIRDYEQVFVDKKCIYVTHEDGSLRALSIGPYSITAEELEFIARFI